MGYRYIGSKSRIANEIVNYISEKTNCEGYFIDAFSGTGVIGQRAAEKGWKIVINDMLKCATIMSEARLISEDQVKFTSFGGYDKILTYLNNVDGREGYIWREYSPASCNFIDIERRYFSEKNAKKIDGLIFELASLYKSKEISEKELHLLQSDLLLATNDVANIAGTYGCYLSHWTAQSQNDLLLKKSSLQKKQVEYIVSNSDVFSIKSSLNDVVYLDPPYTKRQYASYYHILETIVQGDEPAVEGTSGLRPWKEKASVFCYKKKALNALVKLICQQSANRVFVSYSDDGHIILDELLSELKKKGNVKIISLGEILRYTPNSEALSSKSKVNEYLIDFQRENR